MRQSYTADVVSTPCLQPRVTLKCGELCEVGGHSVNEGDSLEGNSGSGPCNIVRRPHVLQDFRVAKVWSLT